MRIKETVASLFLVLAAALYAQAEATYESEHGFKIEYPQGWHLETFMDIYKSLREAERVGGNFFRITSYPPNDPRADSPRLFSRDMLRIDVWVYPGYNGTLGELVTQTRGVSRLENIMIDGKKAKKVWREAEDSATLGDDKVLSIYYVNNKNKVIFVCLPTYSSLLDKCDEVAKSFRFE